MPKFAANLSFLFTDHAFRDRFRLAAGAGFQGVEYLFPYDWPARERGLACLPDRHSEFAEGVELALNYAMQLDCERVHCMAGLRPWGVPEVELEANYIANLRYAADRFATAGATVMIEPINSHVDMPGYWLDDIDKALRLIETIDRSNVKLQLDLYHAQIIHGDLARTIEESIQHIGHVQIADNPGRHEPGTGELHYPFLFSVLERMGYTGWIGCEYKPLTTTEAGLGWMSK